MARQRCCRANSGAICWTLTVRIFRFFIFHLHDIGQMYYNHRLLFFTNLVVIFGITPNIENIGRATLITARAMTLSNTHLSNPAKKGSFHVQIWAAATYPMRNGDLSDRFCHLNAGAGHRLQAKACQCAAFYPSFRPARTGKCQHIQATDNTKISTAPRARSAS